jgi:hypothetical protein
MENLYDAATNDFSSSVCGSFSFRLHFLALPSEGGERESKKGTKMDRKKWQPGKIQLQLRIRMVKSGAVCGCSIACDVYNGFLFDWKNR